MLETVDRPGSPFLTAERWRRYRGDGDRRVRDELVLTYAPLVKHVAGRICVTMPAHVDLADLIAYGFGGLVEAIERFDPANGAAFESYAGLRIRGAIFDGLRALDWVPRAVRTEGRQIQRANADLSVRLQRLPGDAELAAELGIDGDELAARLQRVANSCTIALDGPARGATPGSEPWTLLDLLSDHTTPDPAAEDRVALMHDRVADAVLQLSGREQTILALRYHQDLNFTEIGEVLEVTDSRVSQIHAKLLLQLRGVLTAA
jgi:RNA polymerase sigma factor for flagellar operon FliA